MNLVFHLLGTEASPTFGGMEESILRIGRNFLSRGATVFLYTRNSLERHEERTIYSAASIELVELKPLADYILAPLPFGGDPTEHFRVYTLVFTNEVARRIAQFPSSKHIVVSFLISSNGFIAQNAATHLGLPHIASIRGTDFSRDFHSFTRLSSIQHVIRNATWIVTTNLEQQRSIVRSFGRSEGVTTIYNPMLSELQHYWKPHLRAEVRLICDTGYSFKKGTHLLITAVEQMIKEGEPVSLTVVGREAKEEMRFWKKFREDRAQYFPIIRLLDYMPKNELINYILDFDIYCSATLGEGCANGSLSALALGIPIVATDCGALSDFTKDLSHVYLSPPGDPIGLKTALVRAVEGIKKQTSKFEPSVLARLRTELSPEAEINKWNEVVTKIILSTD